MVRPDLVAAMTADHYALLGSETPGAVSVPGVRQHGGASGVAAPPCTTLTIPMPPSVNKMFANKPARGGKPGGRFKTLDYKNWLGEAGWMVREQMAQPGCDPVPGRTVVLISAERESLLADIDNRVKAILDLLVQQKVIEDDRWVTGVATSWAPRGTGRTAKARVLIMPAIAHTLTFHPTEDGATGGWFIDAPFDDGEI